MSVEQAEEARRVVLIRGDAFSLFLRDCYARARWRKALLILSSPWLLVVLPFSRRRATRALVHLGLLGVREVRYRALVQAFAATLVRRPGHFHRDGLRTLRRHQAAGDRIVIVTGCEDSLVRAVLAELGVVDVEVLASRLREGRLGLRADWHNVGQRKVELLARHGIDAWHVAYGDSDHDLPMLALAGQAVLVNATPRFCRRVEKALGRAVTRAEWN